MKTLPWLLATLAIALAACGGGGGSSGTGGSVIPNSPGGTPVPSGSSSPGATPTPLQSGATPTPKPTPTPVGMTPTPKPTATPIGMTPTPQPSATPTPRATATPTPRATATPVPTSTPGATPTPSGPYPASRIRNTYSRIGLAQIFDNFPNTGTSMSSAQITSDASRYDIVWGSFNPQPWRSANPSALITRYYILEEDNKLVSGHDLSYWQQNHPDWIMYACDSSGNPTHDIAYTPGDGFADVPLDIHNPAVIDYQVRQSLGPYAVQNGYNEVAIDEVVFRDIMLGGNPNLGQTKVAGEFGCGVWNNDGTFTKRWTSPSDPQWTTDIVNWVVTARSILNTDPGLSPYHLGIVVNHPAGSIHDANEQQLLSNVDATLDEAGFSDYGNYQLQSASGLFAGTIQYMKFVQSKGVAMIIIDKFASDTTRVTSNQLEYSIATYLMGNEGSADLFVVGGNGAGYGYGAEQYYQEYGTALGTPCGEAYGGGGYDAKNPQIFYRRFTNGLAVLNSGSLPTQTESATLPSGHTYTDIEGRSVSNPLAVNSNDSYVMTTGGNGCQ